MFGWRKKNDGFVWNDYVRTTILVRREQRRQKIEDIRDAAVDGVLQAGRKGAEFSVAGAWFALTGIFRSLVYLIGSLGDAVAVVVTASWLWVADRLEPLWALLRRPPLAVVVALAGAALLLSALAAGPSTGLGLAGLASAAIGLALLMLAAIPQLAELEWLDGFRRRPPALSWQIDQGAVVGVAVLVAGALAVMGWLVPALMSQDAPAQGASAPVVVAASHLEGKAVAIGPGDLRVGANLVRLAEIEVPLPGQACKPAKSCAEAAKAALHKLVAGKQVACDVTGTETVGTRPFALATCSVNGTDIAAQLVRGGYVFARSGLFPTYASAEREARSSHLGLWKTDAPRPSEYRAKVWETAKQASPEGCPIKGIVAGDQSTFHLPWQASYDKAKVRPSRGDRWFCSEAEARTAGFTSAGPD